MHDGVGLLRGGHGFVLERLARRRPDELQPAPRRTTPRASTRSAVAAACLELQRRAVCCESADRGTRRRAADRPSERRRCRRGRAGRCIVPMTPSRYVPVTGGVNVPDPAHAEVVRRSSPDAARPRAQSASTVVSVAVKTGVPLHRACWRSTRREARAAVRRAQHGRRHGARAPGSRRRGRSRARRARACRARDRLANAAQRRDRRLRDAVVVAEQHAPLVGVGADDGDRAEVLAERQRVALVLEQHDRLARDLPRERRGARAGRAPRRGSAPTARVSGGSNMPSLKRARNSRAHRRVDLRLGDEPLLHRVDEIRVDAASSRDPCPSSRRAPRPPARSARPCGAGRCRRSRRSRRRCSRGTSTRRAGCPRAAGRCRTRPCRRRGCTRT